MSRPVKNIYADNKVIFPVVKEYVLMYREAEANGEEPPRIPEKLGKVIWDIAEGLSMRYNFNGYTYRDEMVMDGVMDCMKYIHKFNIDKYDKPYSYINKICWQAFVRRIEKEKKQQYISYKLSQSGLYGSDIYNVEHSADINVKIAELQEKFEPKKKGVEDFLE